MNALFRTFVGGIAAVTMALATPAAAQMQVYEDYEPSSEIVEMTMVKVDEGQFDTYLEGIKGTWIAANEVSKSLGHIKDYAIYGVPFGPNEFNLVLVVVYPSDEMYAPSKERYMAFMDAYGKANIDRGSDTVRELYNKIRTIEGTYMLREMKMLK